MAAKKSKPKKKQAAPRPPKAKVQPVEPVRPAGRPRAEAPALPIYDSLQACHAATGIPLQTLKLAKRRGCSAFRSNRVDLGELIKWIFSQEGDDGDAIDWGLELTKEKAKREKNRRLKEEGAMIERAAVTSGIQGGMSILFSELDRIFLAELPPAAKGLTEVKIRGLAEESVKSLRDQLREKFNSIAEAAALEKEAA